MGRDRKPPFSEDTLLALVQSIPEGLLVVETETLVIAFANAAACSMFGRTAEEWKGLTVSAIHPPEQAAAAAAVTSGVMSGNVPVARAVPCRRRDGSVFLADVRAVPLRGSSPAGTALFFLDVTERVRSEEALVKSQEIFSKIFATSPNAIGISRLEDGVFLDINPGFTALTGYTRQDIVGRTVLPGDLGIWETKEERDTLVRLLRENKGAATITARFRRKDGFRTYAVMHARVLALNGVNCLLTITNDVTEMKLAELALSEEKERLVQSEEKFRTLVEQNADGIALLDEAGSIIEWNPALERITGLARGAVLGSPIWETPGFPGPPAAGDRGVGERIRACFAEGLSPDDSSLFFNGREISFTRNGHTLTLLHTIFPIRTDRGVRAGCIFRDVTEPKRLAEALKKTEKLESLGVLAGGIAHDFNNLLGVIFGNLELAAETAEEPKLREHLAASQQSIHRARALTQQLLTFAKGGAPAKRVEPLFPFVERAVSFAASGSRISCRFEIEPGLWACSFDRNQMGQVVDNIVINAIQAMPEGGCLRVRAANLEVKETEYPALPPGRYVRISFSDEGQGISREILPRIFDPFFTTKDSGTGLGLATAHSIVTQHNGHIAVESEPGQGAVFHVLLPASFERPEPGEPAADPAPRRGWGTILVMDDDEGILDTTRQRLERMGYACRTARDGREALEQYTRFVLEGGTWRAIICDLTIPGGMSGRELAAEIRQFDRAIPIIVSSGYAEDPIISDPARSSFTDSLRKPYSTAELAAVLERALSRGAEDPDRPC